MYICTYVMEVGLLPVGSIRKYGSMGITIHLLSRVTIITLRKSEQSPSMVHGYICTYISAHMYVCHYGLYHVIRNSCLLNIYLENKVGK